MFISFQVQLARFALRGVPSSVVKWMAIDLIQRGFESPQLDDLAWEPLGRDSATLFHAAAKSIGLKIPSREQAEATLLRHYIERIASTESDGAAVGENLGEMIREVCLNWDHDGKAELHDVKAFVEACWTYEDLTAAPGPLEGAALAAFSQDLRVMASAWLASHPLIPD